MAKYKITARMTMEDLFHIGQLFASLQWPTDDTRASPFPFLFTRFCRMWARLAPDERALLMKITPSYTWIRNTETEQRFMRVWETALASLPAETKSVALVNLPKIGSKGPKSHDSMFYTIKGCEAMLRLSGVQVSLLSSYSQYKGTHNTTLALIDDYIGTGDSIRKALKLIQRKFPAASWNAIFIIALAAQEQAITSLKALGCTLIADAVLHRGIMDSSLPDKNEAYRIMNDIGLRLGISQNERLGYRGTEGLITMTRTPNNTFPVYWTTRKVRGRLWNAPFPRFTERTRPDWDVENSWNFPMPSTSNHRLQSIELSKVLECIRDRRDPQVLEEYKIPFSRSLYYLRSLLHHEEIEFQGDTLQLTPAGHRRLNEAPIERETAAHPQAERLAKLHQDEPPAQEQKGLYIPEEEL